MIGQVKRRDVCSINGKLRYFLGISRIVVFLRLSEAVAFGMAIWYCNYNDQFCNSLFHRRKLRPQTTALYFWSGGSPNADFKAYFKLSSFWRSVVSFVNLAFSIDNTEYGHSPTHACCGKVSLVAACKWALRELKSRNSPCTSNASVRLAI